MQAEPTADKLTIQPNPFSSSATLILPSDTDLPNSNIVVFNILGNEVRKITSPDDYLVQLLKEDLPSGMYVVHLLTAGNIKGSVRMVIQ